jgi:hypothetical protein
MILPFQTQGAGVRILFVVTLVALVALLSWVRPAQAVSGVAEVSLETLAPLRAYTYIAPKALKTLTQLGCSEAELVTWMNARLQERGIAALEANRLFEGSEDALRIDVRERGSVLEIELSVRQGVSVNYMLQRWRLKQDWTFDRAQPPTQSKQGFYAALDTMFNQLKRQSSSATYLKGKILGDD